MTLFNKMKAVGVLGVLIGLFAAGGAFADVPTLSAGTVNRTSDIAAEIGFTVGAAGGTAYYQVVASGAAAPSVDATSAALAANTDWTAISGGAVAIGAVTGKSVVLTAGAKDIYVVVDAGSDEISLALKIEAAAYVVPTLSAGTVNRTSDIAAEIGFTVGAAGGTAYYQVVASGAAAPSVDATSTALAANTDWTAISGGAVAVGAVTGKAVVLTAGAKDIYVVVDAGSDKISAALKIAVGAFGSPTLSAGTVNRTSDVAATIGFTVGAAGGTAYYQVVASGATAPSVDATSTALAANTDWTAISGGAVAVGAVTGKAVVLTAGAKDIYVVVDAGSDKISAALRIQATAFGSPTLSAGTVNRTSDVAATIGFTVGAAGGTAYYQVVASGAAAPSVDATSTALAANASWTAISGGAVAVGAVTGKAVVLTAGAKDIYVVVDAGSDKISAALKIAATAYTPNLGTTYTVSGKITGADLSSGVVGGIVGASIQLQRAGNAIGSPVSSGAEGVYTISGVSAGRDYTIVVTKVDGSSINEYVPETSIPFIVEGNVENQNVKLDKAYAINFTVGPAVTNVTLTAAKTDGTPVTANTKQWKENTTIIFDAAPATNYQVQKWTLQRGAGSVADAQIGKATRFTVTIGKEDITVAAVAMAVPNIEVSIVGLDTAKFQVNRPVVWAVNYKLQTGLKWAAANVILPSTGDSSEFKLTSIPSSLNLKHKIVRVDTSLVVDTIKGDLPDLVEENLLFTLPAAFNNTSKPFIVQAGGYSTPTVPTGMVTSGKVAGFVSTLNIKAKTEISGSNITIDNAAAIYQIGQYRKVTPSVSTATASSLTADGGAAVFHVTYRDVNGDVVSGPVVTDSGKTANYGVLDAGTYTVTVRVFNKYYEGMKSTSFLVNKRDISITANNIVPTVTTAGTLTYNGEDQSSNVSVSVKDGQTVLIQGVDWTGGWTGTKAGQILGDGTNAGVDTVKVRGIGNYTGTRVATYSINKLRIYVDTSKTPAASTVYTKYYDGTGAFDTTSTKVNSITPAIAFSSLPSETAALKGQISATNSGATLGHHAHYVVTAGSFVTSSGSPATDSATATRVKITVKLADSLNYTLATSASATNGGSLDFFKSAVITRAQPDTLHFKYTRPDSLVHGYTGKARGIGDVTLKTGLGGMGKFRVLYGADTAKPVNVGSYPVTVSVDSLGANFKTGTVSLGTYVISAPGVPVIDDVVWQTGLTVREGVALALTVPATAPTTGGTLSYQWFRDDVAVANNGRAATLNVNGLIMGNTYTFKVVVTNTKSAGAAGSEVGTVERSVVVNVIDPPVSLSTATFTVKGAYVYTGSPIEPPSDSIVVTVPAKEVGGEPITLTRGTDYTVSFARNTNVGNATVSITGVDEYIGLRTATFQIRAKTPEANDLTFRGRTVYNGKTQAITVSPIAGTGLGTVTVKYDGNVAPPKDAGMYVITADFAAGTNFTAATNVQLGFYTISPLTLTADSLIFKRWPNQILVDSVAKYAIGDVFVRVDSTKLTVLYAGEENVPTTIGSYPVTVLVEDENFVTGLIPLGEFNVVDTVVSVKSGNRVVPGTGAKEVAAVAPVKAATAVFTAGPSPVSKNGTIKFFSAKQVTSGSLYIFDATGKSVAKVGVKAGTGVIGSWSANAAEGSYIVKGVLAGKDGTREKVSFVFSVVK